MSEGFTRLQDASAKIHPCALSVCSFNGYPSDQIRILFEQFLVLRENLVFRDSVFAGLCVLLRLMDLPRELIILMFCLPACDEVSHDHSSADQKDQCKH